MQSDYWQLSWDISSDFVSMMDSLHKKSISLNIAAAENWVSLMELEDSLMKAAQAVVRYV